MSFTKSFRAFQIGFSPILTYTSRAHYTVSNKPKRFIPLLKRGRAGVVLVLILLIKGSDTFCFILPFV